MKTTRSVIASTLAMLLAAGHLSAQQSAEDKARAALQEETRRQEAAVARAREEARQAQQELDRIISLEVQVVVSRFQGDKKISALPYQLSVNATNSDRGVPPPVTSVRMGAKVPLPTMTGPTVDGKPLTGLPTVHPVQYNEIGTFIDASARFLDGGASFNVGVTVEDTSVYTPPRSDAQTSPLETLPVIRSFRSSNEMLLKDGQTRQFTLAADRVSGETLRVDVTLKVAK